MRLLQKASDSMSDDEIFLVGLDKDAYDPLNDVLFKFIFGREERKQITVDFLNAVLEGYLPHEIKDLTFIQTEITPDYDQSKLGRLDVACTLDSGEQVDIEVQVVNEHNMKKRTLFYWSRIYATSLTAGQSYRSLKPAIMINLLGFKLLPQKEPHAMYSVYNIANGDRLNNDMEIHFLEIPKYAIYQDKPAKQLTRMERWLAYFANKLTHEEREDLAMSEVSIDKAMKAARIFMADTAERRKYISRELALMDQRSLLYELSHGREESLAEGRAEGRAEGHAEGHAEGLKQGLAEGRAEGEARLGALVTKLLAEGKIEEVQQVVSDEMIRQKYFEKYSL